MATIDDFAKLDIRVVQILEAERVEGSEKLIKLKVDIGKALDSDENETRQIIAGIGKSYDPKDLIDQNAVAIVNLEPRIMMGFESQGMILATGDDLEKISLLKPDRNLEPGGKIR